MAKNGIELKTNGTGTLTVGVSFWQKGQLGGSVKANGSNAHTYLHVRVVGAANLAKADAGRGEKSDPYVCAFWNDQLIGKTPPKMDH